MKEAMLGRYAVRSWIHSSTRVTSWGLKTFRFGSVSPALPAAGDEPASTHSALLVTRMLRIIAQKAEDLVELQALPEDTLSSSEGIKYFCRPSSAKLRVLMANETSRAADLFFRLNVLAAQKELRQSVIPQLFNLGDVQLPFLLPTKSGLPRPVLVKHDVLLGAIAPQLTVDEQAYAYALEQLATTVYGVEVADFLMGRTASQPATFLQQVVAATSAAVVSRTAQISTVLQPEFLNNLRKRLKETDVGELALALQALDESERQTLQSWVAEVVDKGWQILLRRVSHLAAD